MADFKNRDVVPTEVVDAYFVYPTANRDAQAEMIAYDMRKHSPKPEGAAEEKKNETPAVDKDSKPIGDENTGGDCKQTDDVNSSTEIQSNDEKPKENAPDDGHKPKENKAGDCKPDDDDSWLGIQSNDEKPKENAPDDSKPNPSKPNLTDEDKIIKGVEVLKLDNSDSNQADEEENYIGKWMMFFDQCEQDENGHTQHDRAWFKIDDLYSEGNLYFAKASTGLKSELAHTQTKGCICCYTEDYRNEDDVRKKADLIRSALEEELCETVIYYKTDSATLANKYRVLGSGRVSIYRHKPDRSFWKTSADNTSWDIIRKKNKFHNFRPNRSFY